MQFTRGFVATTIAAAMALGAAAAHAQDAPAAATPEAAAPGAAPLQAAPAAPAADFSAEQLESFVSAALNVSTIQQEVAAELMAIENETEQNEVLLEANQQMIDAIEAEPGISVPEYVAIAEAAETDLDLRAELERMIVAAQSAQ